MKKISIFSAILIAITTLVSCEPKALTEDQVFISEEKVQEIIKDGKLYTLEEFCDRFMTEEGDSKYVDAYRTRSKVSDGHYLFSINDLPGEDEEGIYIRGRVTTDDYGGNFYKTLIIQQIVEGEQQNLRISLDMGSCGGLYQTGQEILIRCNGLSIGRYANQRQLCVPAYNNNINAQKASEKVGWAPGRIPNERFRKATYLVGRPDKSKLVYKTITIPEFFTKKDLTANRKLDAMLVKIENVYFTGEYENNGSLFPCHQYAGGTLAGDTIIGDPESDGNAAVFGPTTYNVGYPQSRVISDGSNKTLVSCSEYAKYAHFLLPASSYKGTIYGILGFYADNAKYATASSLDGYEWSITPRHIFEPFADIKLNNGEHDWFPEEFTK